VEGFGSWSAETKVENCDEKITVVRTNYAGDAHIFRGFFASVKLDKRDGEGDRWEWRGSQNASMRTDVRQFKRVVTEKFWCKTDTPQDYLHIESERRTVTGAGSAVADDAGYMQIDFRRRRYKVVMNGAAYPVSQAMKVEQVTRNAVRTGGDDVMNFNDAGGGCAIGYRLPSPVVPATLRSFGVDAQDLIAATHWSEAGRGRSRLCRPSRRKSKTRSPVRDRSR
jgi:hypothetical protein